MDPIIPQQDSLIDMDDWYNFTLPTGDMAEPVGCLSHSLAPHCQSNPADFTQSPHYFAIHGAQCPWNTIDTSLFYQSTPTDSMPTATTPFPRYVPGPMQSYSPDSLLEAYAREDEAQNSDSSKDYYQLPDLEPSLCDSSASSEVEDCVTATTMLSQRTLDPTLRRGRSREKCATNKPRKVASKTAASLDPTRPHRVSKTRRANSRDSEDLDRALAKQTHTEIERRYRNNLNAKMWQLQRTLEGTSRMSSSSSSSSDDSDSPQQSEQQQQQPPRKSDILSNALQYINESELEMRHMTDEIFRLKSRLAVLQQMVQCEENCAPLKQIVGMKMAS
ncbi:uncharacterized protein A1O5_07677 [Cladophialophora psammophila CBS 110553]|uniref:BHLH domain-containing protein n=1 Tax=Cladophialophora psammophila CBS 110553 TaxID=1182543 RepID=W9WY99_9EURO|nr:uncharacterized protein A1O5_07677 [Cladophialophora psammophila CBS 110553]EXJ69641.1 hypothetical protein A1O5_07677 [Cladophialophora psammophila CBS 110553]